ncbi:hypothetical protein RRU94_21780 [Domibacillus sp. DTU_2020_1001157_1_SI_ALB_TIR_016]|uniref:hypothetical protein n=1 Tax=Domibacillus sp. DTU_2020_1001157_1_SI_ALB_TIR_016 TaxID=3077789 RepID=UPI0028E43424|nr:hypothetical protein [Domibacillus sp. DTU_2020_1001157_1_SI_ALB_TIR_016]WNS80134.1 hypothetical protein RRU94_21780 [Domibacillus sp. DTU_2020_1001157_1_SI_ALB_TIR_016]
MKTSTMGIIIGSSALASAGAVKMTKGYSNKKQMAENRNQKFSAVKEVKKGIKNGVKAGTGKTADLIKTGVETEEEMIKGGINKTIQGVKTGIEAQQKMMEKEKEMLDRMNSSLQKKEMTMGVVVGSTALLTTGIVLALNTFQQKQEAGDTGSGTVGKIGNGLKAGTTKVVKGIKNGIASKKNEQTMVVEKTKFIDDKSTELKKDEVESVDSEKAKEYEGLTGLDAQYRDEWQANGFPQTNAELKALEEAEGSDSSAPQKEKNNLQ